MRVDEFYYQLPGELIAQRPLATRDASRMLVLDRGTGQWEDCEFRALPKFFGGEELLVVNNARVLPARLLGRRAGVSSQPPSRKTAREHLKGVVEVFLTRQLERDLWQSLVHPGRKMPVGERIAFGAGELEAQIVARGERGLRTIRLKSNNAESVAVNIERLGHVPLPPYIDRPDESSDRERYQTVFSRRPGAVAAPTAGLHFTPEILERIRERGCEICEVTLDVGLGTFQPIHAEILEEHKIHSEAYEIPEDTAEKVIRAKQAGRAVVAVGTTVVRTLEDAAGKASERGSARLLCGGREEARLFIVPGYRFRVVDVLLTNFHLPKSTLLALVAAFAGRENLLAAYRHAIDERYRFYSYGDCMLIR